MLRSAAIAIVLLAALTAPAARAQNAQGNLIIELNNLAPQGAVMLQLFNSEPGYANGDAVHVGRVAVIGDTATIRFDGLTPGQYAFRLFHDLNGDGRMNTNPFGIPTEPFAFSNNARGSFGPARWADAAFTLNAGANTQAISVEGMN